MKIDDIANLLAEKINQSHYIKHYLNNVFINGFQKGAENSEKFAIGFAKWLYKWDNTRLPNGNWIIGLGLKAYTSEEVLEIYKKTLE